MKLKSSVFVIGAALLLSNAIHAYEVTPLYNIPLETEKVDAQSEALVPSDARLVQGDPEMNEFFILTGNEQADIHMAYKNKDTAGSHNDPTIIREALNKTLQEIDATMQVMHIANTGLAEADQQKPIINSSIKAHRDANAIVSISPDIKTALDGSFNEGTTTNELQGVIKPSTTNPVVTTPVTTTPVTPVTPGTVSSLNINHPIMTKPPVSTAEKPKLIPQAAAKKLAHPVEANKKGAESQQVTVQSLVLPAKIVAKKGLVKPEGALKQVQHRVENKKLDAAVIATPNQVVKQPSSPLSSKRIEQVASLAKIDLIQDKKNEVLRVASPSLVAMSQIALDKHERYRAAIKSNLHNAFNHERKIAIAIPQHEAEKPVTTKYQASSQKQTAKKVADMGKAVTHVHEVKENKERKTTLAKKNEKVGSTEGIIVMHVSAYKSSDTHESKVMTKAKQTSNKVALSKQQLTKDKGKATASS